MGNCNLVVAVISLFCLVAGLVSLWLSYRRRSYVNRRRNRELEEKIDRMAVDLVFSEIAVLLYNEVIADDARGQKRRFDPALVQRFVRDEKASPVRNVGKDIGIIRNIDEVLRRTLERGLGILGAQRGYLLLADEAGNLAADDAVVAGDGCPIAPDLDMIRRVIGNGGSETAAGDPHDTAAKAVLVVPVRTRDRVSGVCCFERRADAPYTPGEARIAGEFLDRVVQAVENAFIFKKMKASAEYQEQPVLTPEIEEKVKKAIAYLDLNYTADISREGLAASLDMHPDTLGRSFKIFTGRKINDYLNERRVREVAEKLCDSEVNIIELAFAAGFESLSTFNRAFVKVFDMTPTEYRERCMKM